MQKKSIDSTLVFIVIALVIFGMIMISSVSVYPSFKITSRMVAQWLIPESNNYFYLSKNIAHVLVGLFLLMIFSKIPYFLFEKHVKIIFAGSFFTLLLVLLVWVEYNGARWWLNIPGLPSVQPIEFAKIWLILFLAYFIKKRRSVLANFSEGFVPFFLIALSFFILLALQPDFGSILIIAPVVMALYFVAGGNSRYLIIALTCCLIGALGIYSLGKFSGSEGSSLHYISERIDNFFDTDVALFEKGNDDNKTYQTKQGLLAIGSGGFFGLGFGKSIQKFWYLPEVQGDFIFSVIVEELWFFWATILLWLYATIVFRWFAIARWVKDPFGKYTAFGITMLILVQMFVNIGVNLNVIPLTGVTLPFVSYGGSSLISLLIATGILLNISRYIEYPSKSDTYANIGQKRRIKV